MNTFFCQLFLFVALLQCICGLPTEQDCAHGKLVQMEPATRIMIYRCQDDTKCDQSMSELIRWRTNYKKFFAPYDIGGQTEATEISECTLSAFAITQTKCMQVDMMYQYFELPHKVKLLETTPLAPMTAWDINEFLLRYGFIPRPLPTTEEPKPEPKKNAATHQQEEL